MHRIGGETGPLYALEAIPRLGVVLTPIDSLVTREQGATFVLQRVEDVDATSSVRKALRYVGLPYDDLFLPGDSAIYCSELVQISYVDRQGRVLFDTIPMSFHDASGRITDHWTEFYRQRGMTVPEEKEIFGTYGASNTDTGSPEAQIALFSYRISHLTEHLKVNKKDHTTQRALKMLVGKRRKLLDYLMRKDINRYRALIAKKELGIRK